jgi:hypothetical protein
MYIYCNFHFCLTIQKIYKFKSRKGKCAGWLFYLARSQRCIFDSRCTYLQTKRLESREGGVPCLKHPTMRNKNIWKNVCQVSWWVSADGTLPTSPVCLFFCFFSNIFTQVHHFRQGRSSFFSRGPRHPNLPISAVAS